MAIDGDTLQILPACEDAAAETSEVSPVSTGRTASGSETDANCGCRVRLWGVDANEVHEDGGEAASAVLSELLARSVVDCAETHGASYGRVVARCVLVGGPDISAEIVRLGWAVDSPLYSGGRYAAAEAEARVSRRGMWSY